MLFKARKLQINTIAGGASYRAASSIMPARNLDPKLERTLVFFANKAIKRGEKC